MPLIITKIAWLMQVTMGTSAAESLSAAGNIFVGQVSHFFVLCSVYILKGTQSAGAHAY